MLIFIRNNFSQCERVHSVLSSDLLRRKFMSDLTLLLFRSSNMSTAFDRVCHLKLPAQANSLHYTGPKLFLLDSPDAKQDIVLFNRQND